MYGMPYRASNSLAKNQISNSIGILTNICCNYCLMALQNSITITYKSLIRNCLLSNTSLVKKIAILISTKIETLKGVPCFCKKDPNCCAPLFKECPQYHGHKTDPGVTSGTCKSISERTQLKPSVGEGPGVLRNELVGIWFLRWCPMQTRNATC